MGIFCISGVKITCPQCSSHIATVLNDLCSGGLMQKRDFKFESSHYPHDSRTVCGICGSMYIVWGQIHTEFGWVGGNNKITEGIPMTELIKEITY